MLHAVRSPVSPYRPMVAALLRMAMNRHGPPADAVELRQLRDLALPAAT
jgi:hypothetical protein